MSRDALVVGINTYQRVELSGIQSFAKNAEAIAQRLEQACDFTVRRLPLTKSGQVGQKTEVTLNQLEDALEQLFLPADPIPEAALFYFSGHGLRKPRKISEGFLATSDVNPDQNIWGVSLKWLCDLLWESQIPQQIVWLDCCYSGEFLNFSDADPGDSGKRRCFIAACRGSRVAYESREGDYGILTKALLAGLADDHKPQQWLTNLTLVDFIDQSLRQVMFDQTPIFRNVGDAINLRRPITQASSQSKSEKQIQAFQSQAEKQAEKLSIDPQCIALINLALEVAGKRYIAGQLSEKQGEDFKDLTQQVNALVTINTQLQELAEKAINLISETKQMLDSEIENLRLAGNVQAKKMAEVASDKAELDRKLSSYEIQSELVKQFQDGLRAGQRAADWLDTNRKQLARRAAEAALTEYPDLENAAASIQISGLYLEIEQYLERISYALRWGTNNFLDEPDGLDAFPRYVHRTAFEFIRDRRIPEHLPNEAITQLKDCLDYFIIQLA
jgi:hypothetical protein